MSIARHHNEWLSLLEASGPFLSLPVLMRVFPQGLEEQDSEARKNLRIAHDEWEADGRDPAIHTAWLEFVLGTALEYPENYLLSGQAIPPGLDVRVPEHNELLRPTWVLKAPEGAQPSLLVSAYPPEQSLDRAVHGMGDADKRTDIEVSNNAGKVCIEIKPLDECRGYSAKGLAEDTLNRQLVGQYLRGKNSQHGVLVVFRLDRKTWQIPGIQGNRGFDELVAYLRAQAQAIAENDHHILRLEVLPIDCTLPT